jgi:hypothetical protein
MGTLRAERVAKDTVKSVLRREASVGALTLALGVGLFAFQAGVLLPNLQRLWGNAGEALHAPASALSSEKDAWSPAWARTLGLGQGQAFADWLFVRALIEDAPSRPLKAGEKSRASLWLDLASRLDPAYFELHQNGALYLSVALRDTDGGLALVSRANEWRKTQLPSWPVSFQETEWRSAWSLPVIQAYLYLFEKENLVEAGKAYQEAASHPKAPLYLKSLGHRFDSPGGIYEAGVRILGFMIPAAAPGAPRETLIRKRAMLIVHSQLWQIDQDFSAYLQKTRVARNPQARQTAWEKFRERLAPSDALGGQWHFDAKTGQVGTTTKLEKVFGVGEGN